MRKRMYINSQRGFTLVEILVAITLLLIITVSFVPLFVYISEGSQGNRARLVATKLASSVSDEIRALPYNEVGLVGGNPEGVIEHETTSTVEGRQYTITTNVWWVDDPSDDTGGNDPIPYDYKRVGVSVSTPGLFGGGVGITSNIHTLASMEGEEEAYPGGNIRAKVRRGWRTDPDEEDILIEDVKIDLTDEFGTTQTLWTEETGRALFAILDEGTYTVEADAGDLGMMVHPMQAEQQAEVTEGVTTEIGFDVEYPCHLALELRNANSGALLTAGGTLVLETPFAGNINKTFTGGNLPASFLGDLWPVGDGYTGTAYNLKVLAGGYLPYDLGAHPEVWKGFFNSPGEMKSLTLSLTPATASVTVTDAGTGVHLAGAAVDIYIHTFTFSGGGWADYCSAGPVASAVTQSDGSVSLALGDNNPYQPPDEPQEGDEYTRYCVKVTSVGYLTFGPEHDAFWVTGGSQMTGAGAVETYAVNLQPDFRSIRVRAEKSNGTPRNSVRIRVTGPGYDEQNQTGADGVAGEALFEDLAPGAYVVSRRQNNKWTDSRALDVQWGEYFVLYRY
ncbi:MAG: prepilin-type N-terminal cleavage/methylation domain-containing protein [Eubacteriales bacterium]